TGCWWRSCGWGRWRAAPAAPCSGPIRPALRRFRSQCARPCVRHPRIPEGQSQRGMKTFLEFEKPIAEIEGKIEELRHITDAGELNIADEVARLQTKVDKLLRDTYRGLTPAQKVQVARHPNRPHALDYIQGLVTDFQPLAGDRAFVEDRAIVGGLGRFRDRSVVVIGPEKGNDTESRIPHKFRPA